MAQVREISHLEMKSNSDYGELAFSKHDFPYDFAPFKSELSSPVDSLATTESEEEDFFTALNRRLVFSDSRKVTPLDLRHTSEVPKVFGGSPQSILRGIESWSGHQSPLQGPSPPATPYEATYDTAALIYEVAGQVERLKVTAKVPLKASVHGQFSGVPNIMSELNHMPPVQNQEAAGFLAEQNYLAAARRAYNAALLYEQHLQNINDSMRYTKSMNGQFIKSPCPSIQQPHLRLSSKTSLQSAPLLRKESVGTGVFLPRTYNTSQAAPQRNTALTSTVRVPAKVVQALNMSFEETSPQSQSHYSAYAASMSHKSYEALMARRDAFLAQQQRRVSRADNIANSNIEVCLPQEWSY